MATVMMSLHEEGTASETGAPQNYDSSALAALAEILGGVWDWNLVTNRIYFNAKWRAIAGCGSTVIRDDPEQWFSRIHPEDLSTFQSALKAHLDDPREPFVSEHRLKQDDGTYRWVSARGTALPDADGKPVRMAGTISDIDERKKRELQLVSQLDELRFALASEKVLLEELDRKNRELKELSITDGLTGLYNHRFLQERFDFEFKRIRRYGGALSCLLIDIDHFKKLNDTWGHQFGDTVIREIASIIKNSSREVDICGRYGGEEFVVISNLEERHAMLYATKLRAAVENHLFDHPSEKIVVTVSVGVAQYDSDVKTKQELIERADKAMYEAKSDGRNLVRVWKKSVDREDPDTDRAGIMNLKEKLQELFAGMQTAYIHSIESLIKVVEAREPFAHRHSSRVSQYSVAIAKEMKLTTEEIEVIRLGALLHDIGKIGVPDTILVKKEPLSDREQRLFDRHSEMGADILRDITPLEKEIPIILYHHERYDGKGFPHGLKGREIPLGARIVAVADAFDGMRRGKSGRELTIEEAIRKLSEGRANRFSPDVVDLFMNILQSDSAGSELSAQVTDAGGEI